MAWIVDEPFSQAELAEKFKELMSAPSILQIPGAHDAMAGLMAKQADFDVLYLSGGAFTASKGLPDLGMITSTEVANRARELIRATNLPVLVDIDTGFGGVLNVARTGVEMLEAEVDDVQIEYQNIRTKT